MSLFSARRARLPLLSLSAVCLVSGFLLACGDSPSPVQPTATATVPSAVSEPAAPPQPVAPGYEVLVGAGDIAGCGPELADAEATARLLDSISGTIFTAGDNTQTAGTAQEFRDCYSPDLGAPQGPDPSGARQPRLADGERGRLLRLLRQRGGPGRSWLLQLRPRRVARHLAQRQRLDEGGIGAGELAAAGPRIQPGAVHAGLLAPAALHVERSRLRRDLAQRVAAALRLRRRDRAQRARPPLRAVRPAGPVGTPRRRARDQAVHGRHRGLRPLPRRAPAAEHRGPGGRARRAEAHAARRQLRLAVHPGDRLELHGFRHRHLPRRAPPAGTRADRAGRIASRRHDPLGYHATRHAGRIPHQDLVPAAARPAKGASAL